MTIFDIANKFFYDVQLWSFQNNTMLFSNVQVHVIFFVYKILHVSYKKKYEKKNVFFSRNCVIFFLCLSYMYIDISK